MVQHPRASLRIFAGLWHLAILIREEVQSWKELRLPLRKRLKAWRRGLLSREYFLYDRGEHDLSLYLSEYRRRTRVARINRAYKALLWNKFAFSLMLDSLGFGECCPEVYGLLHEEMAYPMGGGSPLPRGRFLDEQLRLKRQIVIKPLERAFGEGILILSRNEDGLTINGKEVDRGQLAELLDQHPHRIVEEFVEQHEYARRIFPHATNTIRILTMYDREQKECFIAGCNHRFGTSHSAPVDNSPPGGLWTSIDVDSGEIGPWIAYPEFYDVRWQANHPETGEEIQGIRVPRWEAIKAGVLEIANSVPFLPYVGWDVVVTDAGYKLLEGNHNPGITLLQTGKPLLSDARVRAFYKRHGVI
jgi:hypothetical protein